MPCDHPAHASFQLHSSPILPYCFLTSGLLSWQASLFGAQDGQGLSLVYYFTLPEGWEPNDVGNEAALGMLQRFIHDGREQDKYITILSIQKTCSQQGLGTNVPLWGSVRSPHLVFHCMLMVLWDSVKKLRKYMSSSPQHSCPQHSCPCPQNFGRCIVVCCSALPSSLPYDG